MYRFLGMNKKAPAPDLDVHIKSFDTEADSLRVKLAQSDAEMRPLMEQYQRHKRSGGKIPPVLDTRLRMAMTRRKRDLARLEQVESRKFGLESVKTASDDVKMTMAQIDTMKATNKALKQQYGKINIDKIESLQDEMADLMDVGREINDSLANAYGVPQDVDEEELDAELDALGDEMLHERELGIGETPGFLQDEVPTFIDAPPEQSKVQEPAGGLG